MFDPSGNFGGSAPTPPETADGRLVGTAVSVAHKKNGCKRTCFGRCDSPMMIKCLLPRLKLPILWLAQL